MLKHPRIVDNKYLGWIRTLPCVISGDNVTVQAAHIRFSDARFFKFNPGADKPHDYWVLPLASAIHVGYPHSQHSHGERKWWTSHGIDPLPICLALRVNAYDIEAATAILAGARMRFFA